MQKREKETCFAFFKKLLYILRNPLENDGENLTGLFKSDLTETHWIDATVMLFLNRPL